MKIPNFAFKLLRFGSGAVVSLSSTLAITYVATEWIMLSEKISFAVALICVFFINFLYLRHFVFASALPWRRQMRDFFVASIGFRLAEYVAYLLLLDVLGIHYLLTVVVVLSISFVVKFIVFDRRVFN